MVILLEPVSLGESTAIRVRFFLVRSRRAEGRKILVVKYDGTCRPGGEGESDGRFMLAMGQAGLTAWEPDGLVVDLTELECQQLVDGLTSLLYLGEGVFGSENMPQAVVVGPRCEQAIGTFFLENHSGCGTEAMKEWAYEVGKAVEYVDEEVAKLESLFSGKNRRPESPRDFGRGSPPG